MFFDERLKGVSSRKAQILPAALESGEGMKREVTIIGAGISGLTTAYFLFKSGVPVRILKGIRVAVCRARGERARPVENGSQRIDQFDSAWLMRST